MDNQNYIDKLHKRIEQLEAALRNLLKEPPSILDDPDTDAQIVMRMRKIARGVLAYPEPHYVDPANACDDRSTIEAKSQEALAQERERCIAVCESWIGTFQQFDLKHISTRDYAVDVVEDIIELIREGHDPRAPRKTACPNGLEHGNCLFPHCVVSCPGRLSLSSTEPDK